MSTNIVYQLEPGLGVAEFLNVLERSSLASRRPDPIQEPGILEGMLRCADILVTARCADSQLLLGVARAITDYHYCTYLSDLAVDVQYQRRGIGKRLVSEVHGAAGLHTALILLAAPLARTYYPHIGMQPHDSCWVIPRTPRNAPPESDSA